MISVNLCPHVPTTVAFFLLSLLLYSNAACAADCLQPDIELTSQEAVDNFQAEYGGVAGCDTVTGTLHINSWTGIENLNGLAGLAHVDGHLIIEGGVDLSDISGLAALSGVGGDLVIRSNTVLSGLDGLSALEQVGGHLRLEENAISSTAGLASLATVAGDLVVQEYNLLNLEGLDKLERIGGNLEILECLALAHVSGLTALSFIGGDLVIYANEALLDLDGLSALQHIGGSLVLTSLVPMASTPLQDIIGLSALSSLGGDLIIDSTLLRTLDGLENLSKINGKVSLDWNSRLENVEGFRNLEEVGLDFKLSRSWYLNDTDGLRSLRRVGGDLELSLLPNLEEADGLSSLASVGGQLRVGYNDALSNLDGLSSLHDVHGLAINANNNLNDCLGLARLVDMFDDFEPGPGQEGSLMPDVGSEAIVADNARGCNSVDEILGSVPLAGLNAGLNDAWFHPRTDGQGFFIVIFPKIRQVFLSWFTYDIQRPAEDVIAYLGEPSHRWLTAQGEYAGSEALLDIWLTRGGIFDSAKPVPQWLDEGELLLEFTTCNAGSVQYDIASINKHGSIPIERVALDNVALCYELNASLEQSLEANGTQ